MLGIVPSPTGVPIRLTAELWAHIVEGHPELTGRHLDILEAVRNPDRVVAGTVGELLALRELEPGKWLVAAYRELNGDGFIITAFPTSKTAWLRRKRQAWP